jgi:hypothetical protein
LKNERDDEAGSGSGRIHNPEEIAERLGGISVKSLCELIRNNHLETTTIGLAEASRRGGRRRRLWGMTDAQIQRLEAIRKPRRRREA